MRHCALPKAAILAVLLLIPARQSNAIVLIDDGAGAYLCQAYYVMDSYQGTDCWYWGYGGGSGGGGDQVRTDDVSCQSAEVSRQAVAGQLVRKKPFLDAKTNVTVLFSDGKQTFRRVGMGTLSMFATSQCVVGD
jgi:hypothetical protein